MGTEDKRDRQDSESHPSSAQRGPELPILDPEAEEILDAEHDPADDLPQTVLITGASGNIGRKLRAAWDDHYDLVLLDERVEPDDPDVYAADLSEPSETWLTHFHGVDTVIHLAANPDEFASWEALLKPNLDAMVNVLNASVLAGVDRIVFASSNHVMDGYRALELDPITEDLPPKPGSPYAASKLLGERLGRGIARAFDLEFVALRLGWVQRGANHPETLPDAWARALWLSNRDLVHLFTQAIEVELDEDFVVINGLSNNQGTRWSRRRAFEVLEYKPLDDAAEVY